MRQSSATDTLEKRLLELRKFHVQSEVVVMSVAVKTTTEFTEFCEFVALVREARCTNQSPERILEQFRGDREKWRRWYEGNIISEGQARRGEAKPLDDDAVLARLRKRFADAGIVE